jgi:aminobenzoyl-glutamate utilization protein B
MTSEKACAFTWIDENRPRLITISDRIWEFAELGLVEVQSSAILAEELERHGFTVERGLAGMPTAFLASWGKARPVIGIMGEYDALPGLSQKRVPHKDPVAPGRPGHGCGHNIHGTSGMAAAIAVQTTMAKHGIDGTVKFFGCPAEENFSGKIFLVRDGYFRGVDAVVSHHPGTMNAATLESCLALNSVKCHFYGQAAHAGGSPDQGRSALDAVELMNVGVNFLREHVIQDARIHYMIEQGGQQPNIVPDYARSWYYIRAPERSQVEFIADWVLDIAEGAAKMTRTTLQHELISGIYNVIPNRALADTIIRNMREIGVPHYTDAEIQFAAEIAKSIEPNRKREQLRQSKRPGWEKLVDKLLDDEIPDPWGEGEVSHGSTDVADVSWQTPTVEFNSATWVLGTPGHSWQSVAQSGSGVGHKALIFTAKVMAATAIDLLTDAALLEQAKDEHRQRLGDRTYEPCISPETKPPLDIWEKAAGGSEARVP